MTEKPFNFGVTIHYKIQDEVKYERRFSDLEGFLDENYDGEHHMLWDNKEECWVHLDEALELMEKEYCSLADENEQLKDRYNEQSVEYEGLEEQVERLLDFKDNVFNLINAKIKHYEHKPFSAPVGQPMSVNFDADVDRIARLSELQDLKKELIE